MTVTVKAGPPLHHAHLLPPLPQAFRKEKKKNIGGGKIPHFSHTLYQEKRKKSSREFWRKGRRKLSSYL